MQSIAIIGTGISGLGSAWFLRRHYNIAVFEAAAYVGGHTHTVTVDDGGRAAPVDTGFMVFNRVTYPQLTRLFATLGVPTKRTDMSFGVQHRPRGLEYCGTSLNHLFAQRRNLLNPSFWRMLWQIDRFNREAKAALEKPETGELSLDAYVQRGGYGSDFFDLYLVPMSSAVWSTPPEKMRRFPAATLLRFFHNHGFLGMHTQHPWWTVEGGARTYVEKITAPFRDRIRLRTPVRSVRRLSGGVEVSTDTETTRFDKVIFACHAPEALEILGPDARPAERRLLSAFRYQPNTITLHTDESVLPQAKLARAAWNYRIDQGTVQSEGSSKEPRVSTHYWMNRLQGVSTRKNFFVSVEGRDLLSPERTLQTFSEEHPLFDLAAVRAQPEIPGLNAAAPGGTETYFVGAWQRYGFHEDGLLSALKLATLLLGRDPWAEATEEKGSA